MRWNGLPAFARQTSLAALLALLGGTVLTGRAQAQEPESLLPNPRLSTVTPTGGKAGSTVTVTFSGTDVEEPQALIFSHAGIKAVPVVPPKPPADPKKPPVPPPPVTEFKVTVGDKVPAGFYDVRLVNKWGVSNPRVFVVGDLTEVAEKEPNDDVDQAQRVKINTTVTGAVASPTDVDYFVFAGKKGQRVIVSCLASSVDSRLEPELRLFGRRQKMLACNRHYQGTDALVDCTLPADGDYYVRLCGFTYAEGSPEHFYRLSITTAPWIDAVHPCVVEPGKATQVTVYGRNLPDGKPDPSAVVDGRVLEKAVVTITPPNDAAALHRLSYSGRVGTNGTSVDGFEYRVRSSVGISNPFLLTFATAPVVVETEAHDTPETAQEITLPCEIAGRVQKKRDRDWYTFSAKKGAVYNMEVFSERLGAPTDIYFSLRNPATKQEIVEVDDHTESLANNFKFYAVTDDPGVYTFTAPADGKYQLLVSGRYAEALFGPRDYYRVRITPARPDFHLAIMPAAETRPDGCLLMPGGSQCYTVFAWRHDGWDGGIVLTAEGLPKGVSCQPQTLGSGMRQTSLVVSAAADAAPWTGAIKVTGKATIGGKAVVREARPVSITWPVQPGAGIPTVNRLNRELMLAVRDKAPYNVAASIDKATLVQGGKATLSLKLARLWPEAKVAIQLQQPQFELVPNLLINNNQPITMAAGQDALTAPVVVNENVVPGTYNIVLRTTAQVPFNKDPKGQKQPIAVVLPATPVAITVLPKQVATVTLSNANPALKVGAQAEVVVSVARMYDYAGPFKVQLVLPANTAGVTADEVTIAAGKNQAKLVLKAPANAAVGNRANLTVRLTALVNGNVPTVHDAAINVNVEK
ncbi:MAG TPA: PPC domain-containing protein [Gemmataceae bacterium]|nr:PPC domain-containing protein [Gemmataceae bacterium]